MTLRRSVVVLAFATLGPGIVADALAQAVVRGQVRDSLTGRPFAGARVALVPQATPWSVGGPW